MHRNTVETPSFNPAKVKSEAEVLATMRGLSRKWVWRWAEDNTPAASRSDLPRWRLPARAMRPPAPRLSCIRSEEHTSELQSLMRISYAVFCLKKKKKNNNIIIK